MLSLSQLAFTDHAVKYKKTKLINISFPRKITHTKKNLDCNNRSWDIREEL